MQAKLPHTVCPANCFRFAFSVGAIGLESFPDGFRIHLPIFEPKNQVELLRISKRGQIIQPGHRRSYLFQAVFFDKTSSDNHMIIASVPPATPRGQRSLMRAGMTCSVIAEGRFAPALVSSSGLHAHSERGGDTKRDRHTDGE